MFRISDYIRLKKMLLNGLLQKKLPVLHIPVISLLFDVTSRNDSWQNANAWK